MKRCTKCGAEKAFSGFHKDATHKDGHRSFCKECVVEYSKQHYTANKERIVANVYVWIAENREAHNAKCNRWAKLNGAKKNALTAARYASKKQATPHWIKPGSDEAWMIDEAYTLAKLRQRVVGGKWEVDHIVPLRGKKVSGLHVPWNLQVIRMQDNRRKSCTFV